jgi:transcriptional regulator with XRE-family HTH domain
MQAVVHIGERLKRVRLRRMYTQRELADEAGLSERAIVELEANRREPRPATLRKLVGALKVEPEDLIGED